MDITIVKEDINSQVAKELLDELSKELERITGNSGQGSFDSKDMINPRSVFVIASGDKISLGCGALREISTEVAEIKRMYARKNSYGVGTSILSFLEEQARDFGYKKIILETRKCNEKALGFYLKNGYQIINNYGKYENMPEAVCFEKKLV